MSEKLRLSSNIPNFWKFRGELFQLLIFTTLLSGCSTSRLSIVPISNTPYRELKEVTNSKSSPNSNEENEFLEQEKAKLKIAIQNEMQAQLNVCRSELADHLMKKNERFDIQAKLGQEYDILKSNHYSDEELIEIKNSEDGLSLECQSLTPEQVERLKELSPIFEGGDYEEWVKRAVVFEVNKRCGEEEMKLKIIENWLLSGLSGEMIPDDYSGSMTRQIAYQIFASKPPEFSDIFLEIEKEEDLKEFLDLILSK